MQIVNNSSIIFGLYAIICLVVAVYFFTICTGNTIYIHKNTKKPLLKNGPKVSVLLPARNEEKNLENCLNKLVSQDYQNYDIFVLDDNSTDRTLEIALWFKKNHSDKVHVIQGKSLPADWNGKPYAMHQLVQAADGEILLFTDVDTKHKKSSVSFAVTNLILNDVDMISGYIHEEMETFGEKITVSSMFLLSALVVPLFLNGISKFNFFSNAIGQYIAVKADAFKKSGGYEVVKKVTTEDVFLARNMKKCGFKTLFIDIKNQCSCRMYEGYINSVHGIGKNLFDFLGKSAPILFLVLSAVIIFLVIPPFFIYFAEGFPFWIKSSLVFSTNFQILTWFFLLYDRGNDIWISILYPLIFLNIVIIGISSFCRTVSGKGFQWKGRTVS